MVLLRHRCKSPFLKPLISRVFAGVLQKLWAVLDGDLYRQNEQNCWTWRAALSYESQTRANSPDLSCSEVTQMLWMASGFVYSLAHAFIKVDGYGLTETHKPYQIHSHSHSPLKLWYLTHTQHIPQASYLHRQHQILHPHVHRCFPPPRHQTTLSYLSFKHPALRFLALRESCTENESCHHGSVGTRLVWEIQQHFSQYCESVPAESRDSIHTPENNVRNTQARPGNKAQLPERRAG